MYDKNRVIEDFNYFLRKGDVEALDEIVLNSILLGWYDLAMNFASKMQESNLNTSAINLAMVVYHSIRLNMDEAFKYADDDPYALRFLYEVKGENRKAYDEFKRIKNMPEFHRKLREFLYYIYRGEEPDFDVPEDENEWRRNLRDLAYGYLHFIKGDLDKALDILQESVNVGLKKGYEHNVILMMRPLIPITYKYFGKESVYSYLNAALNISQKNKNIWAYEQFWIFSRYIDRDIDDALFKEKLASFKKKGLIIHQILLMGLRFEKYKDAIMKLVEEHWQHHTLRMCEMFNSI